MTFASRSLEPYSNWLTINPSNTYFGVMLEVAELGCRSHSSSVLIVGGEGGGDINLPRRPSLSSQTGRHSETANPSVIIA